MAPKRFTALVMAGSRPAGDPLAAATGVTHKALAPIAGAPMLAHVLGVLDAAERVDRLVVCGLDASVALAEGALRWTMEPAAVTFVRGAATPGASAAEAIATLALSPPLLITTADHPLLTARTVDEFCARSAGADADVTFGLAVAEHVGGAFPGIRRTVYRFREGGFCGCNLYALLTDAGRAAPQAWMRVERHRKRPWRLVGDLGLPTLVRFALGRLALADVTALARQRIGLRVQAVILSDPCAGFDVDTPAQLRAAEEKLRAERVPE